MSLKYTFMYSPHSNFLQPQGAQNKDIQQVNNCQDFLRLFYMYIFSSPQ